MTSEEINQMLTAGVTEENRTEILSGLNNEINQRGEITSTTPPVDLHYYYWTQLTTRRPHYYYSN